MNHSHHSHLSVSHGENYVILSFLGLFIYVVLVNAWVTEDAYITFRVVDNFVNGYGLTWNVTERVQVFTNPLWLFVHIPFYFVTKEIFLTTIFISVLFDIATFLISARLFKSSVSFIFAFLLIPLVLSRSFTEYATSGLENPLTFWFLAWFCMVIFRKENLSSFSFIFYCFLVAGLAAVNRLDTLIFYLPTLLFLFISQFSRKVLVAVLLGLLPLILWELFSLFYYGFLFPNTAYAKLSTGIETEAYIRQGIAYAIDLLKNDPFSSVTIILAISLTLYSIYHSLQNRRFFTFEQLLGMGLLFYCLYIVKVGGDFMSGRFWAAPFFLAVLLLNSWLHPYDQVLGWRSYIIGVTLIGIFVGLFPKSQTQATVFSSGVADERGYYVETNGLLNYIRITPTNHGAAKIGIELNKRSKGVSSPLIKIEGAVGMRGFYAGPRVVIIDRFALTDPLLARLPITTTDSWRIGHFNRFIPQGYMEFHQTGSFEQMSKTLAEYYKPLHYIVSGPLFDLERLKTIWRFNSGEYDRYLQEYLLGGNQPASAVASSKYPMFFSSPYQATSSAVPIREDSENGQSVLMVHAPGEMRFAVNSGTHRLTCEFGLLSEAYLIQTNTPTDGVEFSASLLESGQETVLFKRFLQPVQETNDRGIQSCGNLAFEVKTQGDLVLHTHPGPANNANYDWSFWRAVKID